MASMDVKQFESLPVMGILRDIGREDIRPLLEAVISAGLETIEITMNTPGAAGMIEEAVSVAGTRLRIGAGTVLSVPELETALNAGAGFIVMPAAVKEVIDVCKKRNVPFFPGALTPHEVFNAWETGPAMVKVFPSGLFGPGYIKELRGPFRNIKLMVVGGVRLENIPEFFSCGVNAVAFGASVFRKEWIEKKDFASIGALVKDYVTEVRKTVENDH